MSGVVFKPAGGAPPSAEIGPSWFAVGPSKLIVMSAVTLGLYQWYWFFQQWKRVRQGGEDIRPLVRSIFGVIFCYPLFRRMIQSAGDIAVPGGAGVLAVAYIVLCVSSNAPWPFGLAALASVLPLAVVQRVASAMAERDFPHDDPNRRLTGSNWMAVALGIGFLGFVTYGLAVREKPTSLEFLTKVAAEANQAPRTPQNGVTLERAVAQPGTLVYYFSLTSDEARQRFEERKGSLKPLTTLALCREPLVKEGVTVRFVYSDPNGQEIAAVDVSPDDCGV